MGTSLIASRSHEASVDPLGVYRSSGFDVSDAGQRWRATGVTRSSDGCKGSQDIRTGNKERLRSIRGRTGQRIGDESVTEEASGTEKTAEQSNTLL